MWRYLFIVPLIAHGLVHVADLGDAPALDHPTAPIHPAHSWLFGDRRAGALAFALVSAGLLVAGGIGLWAHLEWWRTVAGLGLGASLGLMVVYFNPWFLFIEAVNASLIVGLLWLAWPSKTMVGA